MSAGVVDREVLGEVLARARAASRYSGFVSKGDPVQGDLVDVLGRVSAQLDRELDEVLPPWYRWPRQTARWWSRVYEYPFVLAAICELPAGSSVLDVGCGVSPLPLVLASVGYPVVAVDTDAEAIKAMRTAAARWGIGGIEWAVADPHAPLSSFGQFDAVSSVSVLEHTPDPVSHLEALLVPVRAAGLIAVTFDYAGNGPHGVSDACYERMLGKLTQAGEFAPAFRNVPSEHRLTPFDGPFALYDASILVRAQFGAKQLLKRAVGLPYVRTADLMFNCCQIALRVAEKRNQD
jgi:SAM-dependent methyltransferase